VKPAGASGWPAYALAVAAVVAWQVIVLALGLTPALEGRLLDVDGYTHLVRAQELADGGGWYDTTIDRSNAPFGTPMHWTRPFDLALLAGAYAGAPFAGFHAALFWWGVFLPAVLQLLCALLLVWAVAPLLDDVARLFVGVVFVFQLGVSSYAMAGRPDHHLLLLTGFLWMLGLTLRLLLRPFDRRLALWAGVAAGVGLWLSIELLLPLLAVCGGLLLAWVLSGGDRARAALWHAAGVTLAVAAALAVERPPSQWGVVEFDRLSVVCLLPPLLALVFWSVVRALERGAGGALPPRRRLRWALLALGAAISIGAAAFARGFFGSSMYKDPQTQLFFSTISENQPLLPRDLATLGRCLLALGSVAVALAVLPRVLRRSAGPRREAWLFVTLALLVTTASALALSRLAYYPEILATLPVAWALGAALEALGRVASTGARIALRTLAAGAILIGPLALGAAASAAAAHGAATAAGGDGAGAPDEHCAMQPLIELLTRPDALGDRTHVILTHPTYGPELMYRTPHAVVGSPDHRNQGGIHDCVAFFRTSDEAEARAIVERRGVDVVIACRPWLAEEARRNGAASMAARLDRGELPDWLVPTTWPPEIAEDFMILRCMAAR
jgi:hypothetical protein